MNRFCNDTGVGLIPWSPLARGNLARPATEFGTTKRSEREKLSQGGRDLPEVDVQIIGRVQELADKKNKEDGGDGWSMTHVALAWVNKRVASPIVGFSSTARIDEAIAARGKVLTDDDEKYLEELYQPKAVSGHS